MNSHRKRIFTAINLSEDIKGRLLKISREWTGLPVRWIKPDNLHITLVFIGYVEDEELYEICRLAKETIVGQGGFLLKLNRVCLGPSDNSPRMIWAEGEPDQRLKKLKVNLEKAFLDSSKSNFAKVEKQAFRPHITLGRINSQQWSRMPQKPHINKEINLEFSVDSVEVMQSLLKPSGPDYIILESIDL